MRRAAALLFVLLAASPCVAAHYWVRTDGHDTNCNGLDDQPAASGNPCAFLTPGKATSVMNCANPDTVTIRAGTYTTTFSTPDPCQAPSDASRAILEGDGATTVIDGSTTATSATLTLANPAETSMTNRNRFLTVRNLKLKCADDTCITATGTWEGITLDSLTFDHDGGGASNASNGAGAIMMADGAFYWGARVINNVATGTEGLARAGLTGTDAVFIRYDTANACAACTLEKGLYMAGNTVTAFHGALFDGNASVGIIENNTQDTSTCRGDESACVQVYNTTGLCARYNLFKNIKPDGSFGLRLLQVRTTDESSGKRADVLFYNNTLIGSSLTNNGTSVKIGLEINSVLDRASPKTVFANNVIHQNWGRTGATNPGDRAPMMIGDCSDNGVDILNNLLDNNAWPETGGTTPDDALHFGYVNAGSYTEGFPASCTATTVSGNLFDTPPSLETTNWTPDNSTDPECNAGVTTVTCPAQANRPSDTSRSWIGYAQGSCTVGGGGTSGIIIIVISHLYSPGIPSSEVARVTLGPNEALGFVEVPR